jgi:hypothetical protein
MCKRISRSLWMLCCVACDCNCCCLYLLSYVCIYVLSTRVCSAAARVELCARSIAQSLCSALIVRALRIITMCAERMPSAVAVQCVHAAVRPVCDCYCRVYQSCPASSPHRQCLTADCMLYMSLQSCCVSVRHAGRSRSRANRPSCKTSNKYADVQ